MLARLPMLNLLAMVLSLATAIPGLAQTHAMRNQGMMPMMSKPFKGTIITASASQLQFATSAKLTLYAMMGSSTMISVTGTAEREYLKPA